MSRYTVDSFVSASVPGGGSLDISRTISSNYIDISKIKIVPSDGTSTNRIRIYKKAARGAGDILYVSDEWGGLLYVDPPDSGGNELNEGPVCPYYDEDESTTLHITIWNNHTSAKTYTISITYEAVTTTASGLLGSPDGVVVKAMANGLDIHAAVEAALFTGDLADCELRAKYVASGSYSDFHDLRTVAEGGSWVPDGTYNLQLTATPGAAGANFKWTSPAQGRWFIVARLENGVGWSLWTDGNADPQFVTQYVDTQLFSDTGPPADWEVSIEPGPATNTVIVRASRPQTNGNNLVLWYAQIKDGDSGSWRTLCANAGAAVTRYDGSAVAHSYSGGYLTKVATGWGTAQAGDLVLIDVRGGNFDEAYCQWAVLGADDIGSTTLYVGTGLRLQAASDLRIKIVKPPWNWTGDGYLGDEPNLGVWPGPHSISDLNQGFGLNGLWGNYSDNQFVSHPIAIPAAVTNPQARVWFENLYSRSDNGLQTSETDQGGSAIIVPRLFTDFNDRELWLPVYPDANYGSLGFNGDGSCVLAVSGSDESLHCGAVGVRARFLIRPDSPQVMTLRVKFENVTIPVGIDAKDRLFLGPVIYDGISTYGQMWPGGMYTIGTNTNVKMGCGTNPGMNWDDSVAGDIADCFARGYNAYTSATVSRPVTGSTVEIKYYWYASSTYPHHGRRGGYLFIGWIGNARLNGATAKLTEVELIDGCGEVW